MKELLGMSEVICSQKSSVLLTDDLRMAFRHAIDARTQITNHFCRMPGHHGDEMADVTHAFFTSTLQQIYADLRKACAKPKSSKPAEPVSASAHVEKETLSGFAKLKIERGKKKVPSTEDRQSPDVKHSLNDGQAVDDGQQADDGQCLDDHNHAEPVDSKETKRPPRLADDGLAEAFELCKEVQVHLLFIAQLHPVSHAIQGHPRYCMLMSGRRLHELAQERVREIRIFSHSSSFPKS